MKVTSKIITKRLARLSFYQRLGIFSVGGIFLLLAFLGNNIAQSLRVPIETTVDPVGRTIAESPSVSLSTLRNALAYLAESVNSLSYLGNLADPRVKYVRVQPGMRKEQIVEEFSKKLGWDGKMEAEFLATSYDSEGLSKEGYFYPGVYIVPNYKEGEDVGRMLLDRFDREVRARVSSSTRKVLNMDTIVKIASLVEREAAGAGDRTLVAGIIWNRIWAGMSLDIDSTLQYAKGNEENGWWPKVFPEDKYIESPFNTYQNEGLPPTAIANPSLASIEAALKPKKTSCLFFIHDKQRRIHCAKTYEEHKRNIARYL